MLKTLANAFMPRNSAATSQVLGSPNCGVIGWFDGASNASGIPVTEDTALNYSAVWCATRIISETIATLPCILYRKTADDSRERATDDDRYSLIHDEPNPLMNPVTFFETQTAHMVLTGNCYARMVRNQVGDVVRFEPRAPKTVTPETDGESIRYTITDPREELSQDECLHVMGLGGDGLTGYSVVKMAQQSIGSGMAADKQAARQFSNGAMPGGILKHPMRLSKEAREGLRRDWEELHQGSDNAGKIAITHGGMEFQALSMTNEDAQFLESRQFSIREIARWFRLPPHMLADLADSSVRANIEQQAIEFVVYSLAPWLIRWQQTLNRKLLSRDERRGMYFEFLLESLLRGDIASRYAAYSTARQWGWLSVNDIRRSENLNSIDGGDVYLQPSNMVPAGTVPEAITTGLQANLAESIGKILEEGRNVRDTLASGLATAQEAIADANERLSAGLMSQRDASQEIRDEIANLGKVQSRGWADERLGLYREKLACAVKIERADVAKAAHKQASRGESFIKWLDGYYVTRIEAMCERGIANVATCESWCEESKRELLDACDGDPIGFIARVQSVLDSWDERIKTATPKE